MDDSPPDFDTDESDARPEGLLATGMPRWVKVSAIVVVVLVAVMVVMLLVGGEHGPGRH